ncbi:putative TonB protein [Pseudomonas syringae pv. pisi]|nr:putative TonB protein [Pseudomonas syringae pv. pisi]
MTAAQTFRYQPRIVEGRAVTVSGVKNTFHYRIKQDYRVLQAVL